jgi:ankyrin repeat protein
MDQRTIHHHAEEGDLAGILKELDKGTDIDARDPGYVRTPLMIAASSALAGPELLSVLIERGADVNAVAIRTFDTISMEGMEQIETARKQFDEMLPTAREARTRKLAEIREISDRYRQTNEIRESALSFAIRAGNLRKIELLLEHGADISYQRGRGYEALIDAAHQPGAELLPILELLIKRGARLNSMSDYGESALSVVSRNGRFDAVRVLLNAGADPAPLEWTPLMHAIALGALNDVTKELESHPDLSARNYWSQTPWLLSLQVGDVAKAKELFAAGANRSDRGRCGKTAMMYPIQNGHIEMLRWQLSEGFDPNDADDFGETPLAEAVELGSAGCVRVLLDAGANIRYGGDLKPVIRRTNSNEIVRLLIERGADLNEISDDMRALLTRLSNDGRISVAPEDYRAGRQRRFGTTNPEKMNLPFWKSMIESGSHAYAARKKFDDLNFEQPVWCFQRYGKSLNELPDGRFVEIAGEHEDYYDPDFCIFNDVVVHNVDGTVDIYGYPRDIFPPTDFHTATLSDGYLYLIGNVGYPRERKYGEAQVYRLNVATFVMEKVETFGEKPGWLGHHKAVLRDGFGIYISGGKVCTMVDGVEQYECNIKTYVLNLNSLQWTLE